MRIHRIIAIVSLASLGFAGTASANVVNGGFEDGLNGWTVTGYAAVGGSAYGPQEGDYVGLITTLGNTSSGSVSSFLGTGSLGGTAGTAIRQTINVSAGTTIEFQYRFVCNDYLPYNDFAGVVVDGVATQLGSVGGCDGLGNGIPGFQDGAAWGTFTHTFATSGNHTIGFYTLDALDTGFDSGLLIDGFQLTCDEPPVVDVDPLQYMTFPRSYVLEDYTLSECADIVEDDCDEDLDIDDQGTITKITSDELSSGGNNHDCVAEPEYCVEMEIVSNSDFRIRNTRDSYGNGRVYTVHFVVEDSHGNSTQEYSCEIGVRLWSTHIPVADAPACEVTPGDPSAPCL